MDIKKLKDLCNENTVTVSFNGFDFQSHEVINADKLLEHIHETSDLEKSEFIQNINNGNFMTKEYKSIFKSIKRVGVFRTKGDEALNGAKAYIERNSLEWL